VFDDFLNFKTPMLGAEQVKDDGLGSVSYLLVARSTPDCAPMMFMEDGHIQGG
jgi:hypothetical protein